MFFKRALAVLVAALCLSLFPVSGFAAPQANVYLASADAGMADGSSCANARIWTWAKTAGNWGTDPTDIGVGSTVHLCGTITESANTVAFTFQLSGTAGNPITLRFESGAILEAPYFKAATGAASCGGGICGQGLSYVGIDGVDSTGIIRNTANGTSLTYQQATLLVDLHNCTGCFAKNFSLLDVYLRRSATDLANSNLLYRGILPGGTDFVMDGLTFGEGGWLIYYGWITGETNMEWKNLTFLGGYGHGMGIFAANTTAQAGSLTIHDVDFGPPGSAWEGDQSLPTNAERCPYHIDGIHIYGINPGSGSYQLENLSIYNTSYGGDWGKCPTGFVFQESGTSPAHIKNNKFFNNKGLLSTTGQVTNTSGWFNLSGSVTGGVQYVVNNIITADSITTNTTCLALAQLTEVTVQNNILGNCGTPMDVASTVVLSAAGINNNLYGPNNALNGFLWHGVRKKTWALWTAVCACDGSSSQQATFAALKTNADGTLQAGSPAIGLGANLTSLGITALDSDFDGIARPASAAWDAGAYIYPTAPVPGTSPVTSAVTATTLTVSWGAATGTATLAYYLGRSTSAIADVAGCLSATMLQDYTAAFTTYNDTGRSPLASYVYCVIVKDGNGLTTLYPTVSQTMPCGATKVVFTSQPGNTAVGAPLGIVSFSIQNPSNTTCTDSSVAVALANTGGTCTGMTLGGTASGNALFGVFSTTNLTENAAGSCTLTATSSGLTSAVSNSFAISAPSTTTALGSGRTGRR